MTYEEYQELKRRESQLEDELAKIREKTRKIDNEEYRNEINRFFNNFIGHCYTYRFGDGTKLLVLGYDEDDELINCIEVNKEENEICVASEIRQSPNFYREHEISRDDFLDDYYEVLINIEEYLKKSLSVARSE